MIGYRTTLFATRSLDVRCADPPPSPDSGARDVNDAFHWLCKIDKASAVMTIERGDRAEDPGRPNRACIAEGCHRRRQAGRGTTWRLPQPQGAADRGRRPGGDTRAFRPQPPGRQRHFGRLFLREDPLATLTALNGARDTLLTLAEAHASPPIPGACRPNPLRSATGWTLMAPHWPHRRAHHAGLRPRESLPPGQRGAWHLQLSG